MIIVKGKGYGCRICNQENCATNRKAIEKLRAQGMLCLTCGVPACNKPDARAHFAVLLNYEERQMKQQLEAVEADLKDREARVERARAQKADLLDRMAQHKAGSHLELLCDYMIQRGAQLQGDSTISIPFKEQVGPIWFEGEINWSVRNSRIDFNGGPLGPNGEKLYGSGKMKLAKHYFADLDGRLCQGEAGRVIGNMLQNGQIIEALETFTALLRTAGRAGSREAIGIPHNYVSHYINAVRCANKKCGTTYSMDRYIECPACKSQQRIGIWQEALTNVEEGKVDVVKAAIEDVAAQIMNAPPGEAAPF